MVKIVKCFENLMVDVNPSNQKPKERGTRIVLLLTKKIHNVTEKAATEVLLRNSYDIKETYQGRGREHLIRNCFK
jgi:N-acetylmuramic acid 6-phosphate (MurNAc-6-P) etherase